MKLWKLTGLAHELNRLLDAGEAVTFDNMSAQMEARTVRDFLVAQQFADLDLSGLDNDDWAELHAEWRSMDNAIDVPRKLGLAHNGLCLLLAFILEGIRNRWESHEA